MARLRPLKKQALRYLGDNLRPRGFILKPGDQQFYRDVPAGKQGLHIAIVIHQASFDMVADVGVGHAALVELLEQVNRALSEPEGLWVTYVGAELGNIAGTGGLLWRVAGEEDIPGACSGLLKAFEAIGVPYLERFSSLEEVLAVTSRDDPEGWLHSPFHGTRAKTAISAAFVLGRKELFFHLIDQKTEYLKSMKDFGLDSFIRYAEALSKLWPTNAGDAAPGS